MEDLVTEDTAITIMVEATITPMIERDISLFRLFQLISPSLPTGAFSYSQGIEWALEKGWIKKSSDVTEWLLSIMHTALSEMELPLLIRLYKAAEKRDENAFSFWIQATLACRETKELRNEEMVRGRALVKLLEELGLKGAFTEICTRSQLAGFAFAASWWNISLENCCYGYIWSWLENMVMAAVKLVPLGQTEGQKILLQLVDYFPDIFSAALTIDDHEIAGSCPALVMASCRHEQQYTRLFRS